MTYRRHDCIHDRRGSVRTDPHVKNGALEIAITLEGEKEPYTLTVGGPSGSEGYHAKSNKLPGEILVLSKGNFEQVKKMLAYFQ